MTDAHLPPILMFARERFCPDVARTRERLSILGIAWTERDVEADDEAAAEMRRLTGRGNVPTVVIGDRMLVEPSNRELDDALAEAGYAVAPPTSQRGS
jgi:glutaredoxin